MISPKDHPLVVVEWEDITDIEDWDEEDKEPSCSQMLSPGYLVKETKRYLYIARTYDVDNGTFHEVRTYPKHPIVGINGQDPT